MKRIWAVVMSVVLAGVVGLALASPALSGPGEPAAVPAAKQAKQQQGKAAKKRQAKRKKRRAVVPSMKGIFKHVKALTSMGNRRTGTKASLNAARYVRKNFRQSGLRRVRFHRVRSYDWKVTDSSLSVDGVERDSFPIAHALMGGTKTGQFGTGPDGIEAEIVDVGSGSASSYIGKDVAGKVVMFDLRFTVLPISLFRAIANLYYDPDNTIAEDEALAQPYLTNIVTAVQRAMDNGAIGVIGVLEDYFDSKYYFNEEYRALQMNIPGFWVTRNEGAEIRAQMAENPGTTAKLVMNGRRKAAPSRSPIGFLPGRRKATLLISSHHDAVWAGGVEDASGTASVLALARYFGALPKKKRPMSLMFATMDSHFSGYQAHQSFVQKFITNAPAAKRPRMNFAIEHIGRHGYVGDDGKLKMTNLPEVAGILQNVGPKPLEVVKNAVTRNRLARMAVIPATFFGPSLPTDASFNYAAGVPVVSLISGPIYLYDRVDTANKVYKPYLRPMTVAYKQMITKISRMKLADLPGDVPPSGD